MTKIRAIHGSMLTEEDYKILSSKQSLSEVVQYLKSHRRFAETFSGIDVNTVHRGYIEELLKKHDFELFIALRDFQHLKNLRFYNSTLEKYEIEQLLSLANAIGSSERNLFVDAMPGFFFSHTDIDFLELSRSASLEEFAAKLENTKYSKLAESIRRAGEQEFDFTALETDFAAFYYKRLVGSIEKELSKSDGKLIYETVRREIYLTVFINAYRMKAYFGISQEEIHRRLMPLAKIGKIGEDRITQSDSEKEMLEKMSRLPGAAGAGAQNCEFIETAAAKIRLRYAGRLMRTQSMPAVFYAFLQLCDIETSNVIHVIEGIRYGLKPDSIEQLIAY